MQPGTSTRTLLPMVVFQNMSQGPPSTLLQVAIKNNQQPVWYYNDKILFHVLFTEDGRMERSAFLEVHLFIPLIHFHYNRFSLDNLCHTLILSCVNFPIFCYWDCSNICYREGPGTQIQSCFCHFS